MKKKIVNVFIIVAMIISLFPVSVRAKEYEKEDEQGHEQIETLEEQVSEGKDDTGVFSFDPYGRYLGSSDTEDSFYYIVAEQIANPTQYYYEHIVKSFDTNTGEVKVVYIFDHSVYFNCYYKNGKLYYINEEELGYVDLKQGKKIKLFSNTINAQSMNMVVDGKGRIYLSSGNTLYVYDSTGKQIAKAEAESKISTLFEVDDRNGNIYYMGSYNWRYWGYDYDMRALKIARLTSDNTIVFGNNDNPVTILFETWYNDHDGCVELLGGKYLAVLSPFHSDTLFILDSQIPSPKQVKESETTISLVDNRTEISGVNLSRADAVLMATKTRDTVDDFTTADSLSAYIENGSEKKLFVATDEKAITEYDLDSKKRNGVYKTKYPIYKLKSVGDKLVVFEKDNENTYVETITTEFTVEITITGKTSLKVGDYTEYKAIANSSFIPDVSFTSSDNSILSIDENGMASAWNAGIVTVTVKGKGVTSKLKVEVTNNNAASAGGVKNAAGRITRNIDKNDYLSYGSPITSYLAEADKSTLMRVEKLDNESVLVEYLDRSGNIKKSQVISRELSFFAGFYSGKTYNFLVFAQANESESDNTEVLRVVRYDKKWKRNGAAHISNVNTYCPVEAGSLRMTENNGILYIHTCHEMYKSSDGLNHQANMTFEVKESDMSIKDSYYDAMNLSEGYVSHSFNQFIRIYNNMVYRVDHGDAYPRGIAITGYPTNGKMSEPKESGTVVGFERYIGENYTGASVGGFEVSRTHMLIAYNQDMEGEAYSYNPKRNIFVAYVNLAGENQGTRGITSYTKEDGITCLTPQLIKLSDGHFVLMWTEKNMNTDEETVAFTKLDATGKPVGKIRRKKWSLSDCQPIVLSDGTVAWYVTDGKEMKLYNIDFLNGNELEDISFDKSSLSLAIGESITPEVRIVPSNASNTGIVWSSSNPAVAKVDSKGKITGMSAGTVTITVVSAEDEMISSKLTVKVLKTPAQLSITLVQPTMVYTGTELKPAVTVKDSNYLMKEGKDYKLSYKNNVEIGTGTVVITGIGNYTGSVNKTFVITKDTTPDIDVMYRTYVQSYGWQGWVKDGTTSGTAAAAKRMEGLQVKIKKKTVPGSIEYRSYVQTYGWRPWVSDGELSGTKGEGKRVEALQIRFKGEIRNKYNLYYRVYSQGYGWLGWAKNGETAGTAGLSKRIEAVQILPVVKGGKTPTSTKEAYVKKGK